MLLTFRFIFKRTINFDKKNSRHIPNGLSFFKYKNTMRYSLENQALTTDKRNDKRNDKSPASLERIRL